MKKSPIATKPMIKNYRIQDLISRLQNIQKQYGNLLVSLASDEEGNSFSPIADILWKNDEGKKQCTWPFGFSDEPKPETLYIFPLH